MGINAKATIKKIKKLTGTNGEYNTSEFSKLARASASYTNLKVRENVNKKQLVANICGEMHKVLVIPLIADINTLYSELLADMGAEIKRLNIELSGAEETAPVSEAEERYKNDIELLTDHAGRISFLKRQHEKCEKAMAKQNEKIFGADDSDAEDDEFGTFNKDELEILKTLKDHAKGIEKQMQDSNHLLYTKVSSGLHTKDNKTTDRAHFPKAISQMKKKEFIVKVKQYMEHRPELFAFVLPEARRAMDDINRRTGIHFSPGTWDEMQVSMQDEFKQQNDRLYKAFELSCNPKEFTMSHAQYTYGLNGGGKSFGKCEKGDGLRVLHFWLSNLCKISSASIEEVETDLQCLPVSFGTGGIDKVRAAVTAAEEIMERGEEMECMVQYKTVLQICQVLVRKNPLFVQIHQKYLRPADSSGRKNSMEDLRSLMGDIKEVCDQMCGGYGDDTQSVKVNMGMRVFSISQFSSNPNTEGGEGSREKKSTEKRKIDNVRRESAGGVEDEKIQKRKIEQHAFSAKSVAECKHDKCDAKAFCHKKERGGHVHESGLCFDHFVEAVRMGKKEKPEGIPLKGGKKMVLKRGEDMKWSFKIMAVMNSQREKEECERGDSNSIQAMLEMAKNTERIGGGEQGIFHAFMREQKEDQIRHMQVEFEGYFDLRDLDDYTGEGEEKSEWGAHRVEHNSYPTESNRQ